VSEKVDPSNLRGRDNRLPFLLPASRLPPGVTSVQPEPLSDHQKIPTEKERKGRKGKPPTRFPAKATPPPPSSLFSSAPSFHLFFSVLYPLCLFLLWYVPIAGPRSSSSLTQRRGSAAADWILAAGEADYPGSGRSNRSLGGPRVLRRRPGLDHVGAAVPRFLLTTSTKSWVFRGAITTAAPAPGPPRLPPAGHPDDPAPAPCPAGPAPLPTPPASACPTGSRPSASRALGEPNHPVGS